MGELVGLAATLADLGWAVLFLFACIVVTVGLGRQWWVPGWVYRATVERAEKAERQLERNVVTIEALERVASARAVPHGEDDRHPVEADH